MIDQELHLSEFSYFGKNVGSFQNTGLGITLTNYPGGHMQPWHSHENATIYLHLQGRFVTKLRGWEDRTIDSMGVVINPAGAIHAMEGPSARSGLNVEPSRRWLDSYGFCGRTLSKPSQYSWPSLTVLLLRLALHTYESAEWMGDIVDAEMVSLIASLDEAENREAEETGTWFRKLASFVFESDIANCNLRSAADFVGVHPVYLARRFRTRFGCTLGQFALNRRLVLAAEEMLLNGRSVGEAAFEAGFSDQAHLARLFKRELKHRTRSLLVLRAALLKKV